MIITLRGIKFAAIQGSYDTSVACSDLEDILKWLRTIEQIPRPSPGFLGASYEGLVGELIDQLAALDESVSTLD